MVPAQVRSNLRAGVPPGVVHLHLDPPPAGEQPLRLPAQCLQIRTSHENDEGEVNRPDLTMDPIHGADLTLWLEQPGLHVVTILGHGLEGGVQEERLTVKVQGNPAP